MERFWRRLGAGLGRHWPWTVTVLTVLTVGIVAGFSQVDFATGEKSYLDQRSQTAYDNRQYQGEFGGETVVLLFEMDEGKDVADLYTPANVAEFQRVDEAIRALPEVHAVISPLTALEWSAAIACPPPADETEPCDPTSGAGTKALLSAAAREPSEEGKALRQADLQMNLKRVTGVEGDKVEDNPSWVDFLLFANDGFTTAEDGSVVPPADDQLVIRSSLLSSFPNLTTAVGGIVLNGNASLDELSSGTQGVLDIMEDAQFENATVTVTGPPIFLKDLNDYLQGGMMTLGLVAFAVMAVVLILLFPVRLRLLPLLSVLIGVAWTFSLLGYIGIDLSLVTISGLPILIGVGIDFAIQVHNRYEEELALDHTPDPLGETAANLAPAMLAAAFTGVAAFVALRLSKVPMIKDFGVLLAIGIVLLALFGIVMPATVLGARSWKRRSKRDTKWIERFVVWQGSMNPKFAPVIAGIAVLLFAGGIVVEGRSTIQSDPIKWVDQGSQTVKDIGRMEDVTGFSSTLGVLIRSGNVLDPAVIDVVNDFVIEAESRPDVVSSSSLVGTMEKVIAVPGATTLDPTPEDLQGAAAVMPPDIYKALLVDDLTATQVNLRLAPASLEQRALIVNELEADLQARIDAVVPPEGSVAGQPPNDAAPLMQAVPAGLAVVGVALLENLSANRELLTYMALTLGALYLVLRHRSLTRALLALVPAVLAIGMSALLVGVFGITLSPLTTVSGPLVVAACSEFSVLIMARYLEERENGLEPRAAVDRASGRTGRAFFTSAVATIGGFATLVISPLPLLRDFGLIVTLNVATALVAALVAMPPLVVWADTKGYMVVEQRTGSVRLAAPTKGREFAVACGAAVVLAIVPIGMYMAADTEIGSAAATEYEPIALPTTTTTTTTTTTVAPGETTPPIDPSSFGTERPDGLVAGTLYDLMTATGIAANQAVCTAETLLSRVTEDELMASGITTFSDEAVQPVIAAATDCQVTQEEIDAVLTAARGG